MLMPSFRRSPAAPVGTTRQGTTREERRPTDRPFRKAGARSASWYQSRTSVSTSRHTSAKATRITCTMQDKVERRPTHTPCHTQAKSTCALRPLASRQVHEMELRHDRLHAPLGRSGRVCPRRYRVGVWVRVLPVHLFGNPSLGSGALHTLLESHRKDRMGS